MNADPKRPLKPGQRAPIKDAEGNTLGWAKRLSENLTVEEMRQLARELLS